MDNTYLKHVHKPVLNLVHHYGEIFVTVIGLTEAVSRHPDAHKMAIIIIGVIWNELIGKCRFRPRGIFTVTGRIALMPDRINKTRAAISFPAIIEACVRQQTVLDFW